MCLWSPFESQFESQSSCRWKKSFIVDQRHFWNLVFRRRIESSGGFNVSFVLNDDWHILGKQKGWSGKGLCRNSGDVQGLGTSFSSIRFPWVHVVFCPQFTAVLSLYIHSPSGPSSSSQIQLEVWFDNKREFVTQKHCNRKQTFSWKPQHVFCFTFSNVLEYGVSEKKDESLIRFIWFTAAYDVYGPGSFSVLMRLMLKQDVWMELLKLLFI